MAHPRSCPGRQGGAGARSARATPAHQPRQGYRALSHPERSEDLTATPRTSFPATFSTAPHDRCFPPVSSPVLTGRGVPRFRIQPTRRHPVRLAAQCKLGWYPAAPEAIAELVKHLRVRPPDPDKTSQIVATSSTPVPARAGPSTRSPRPGRRARADLRHRARRPIARTRPGPILRGATSSARPASSAVQITGLSRSASPTSIPRSTTSSVAADARSRRSPSGPPGSSCQGASSCWSARSRPSPATARSVEFLDAHYEDVGVYKFPDGPPALQRDRRHRPQADARPSPRTPSTSTGHSTRWTHLGSIAATATCDHLPALGQPQPVSWMSGQPEPRTRARVADVGDPRAVQADTFQEDGVHRRRAGRGPRRQPAQSAAP